MNESCFVLVSFALIFVSVIGSFLMLTWWSWPVVIGFGIFCGLASLVFIVLTRKARALNELGEFEDPDAEIIDNRPRGPLRWLY